MIISKLKIAWLATVFLVCISWMQVTQAATLSASIDRSVISIVDSFSLHLEAKDIGTLAEPDFSVLNDDFKVLSKNVSHSMQSINGVSNRSVRWQLQLQPKHSGKLQIPSFTLKGVSSQVIALQVEEEKLTENDNSEFTLELLANKETVIPQEQVIVTLRFTFAQHVNNLQSSELLVDNAQVIKLKDKSYETRVGGRQFGVYEISYAIFAENPGKLVLPAQKVRVQLGRSSIFNATVGKTISLQSEALAIAVLPVPESTQPFIVADNVRLEETWTGSKKILLGESITREIRLELTGAQAETITALTMPQIPGIKIYPEVGNKKELKTSGGIETSRLRSFAIVPTQTGQFIIPAMKIVWWNALEQKFDIAMLEKKVLEVVAPLVNEHKKPENTAQQSIVKPAQSVTKVEKVMVANPIDKWLLVLCILLFSVSLVLSVLIVVLLKKTKSVVVAIDSQLADTKVLEKQLYDQLLGALQQNDQLLIHQNLLRWGKHLSIQDWQSTELADSVSLLKRQLFSCEQPLAEWDKDHFAKVLKKLRNSLLKNHNVDQTKSAQPSLYPQYQVRNL